ncbi:MAG: hypothetical protein UHU36_05690 [Methanocorpusculum sp.]|nr:hypothetical protein [Methanocorpusculum sp.]
MSGIDGSGSSSPGVTPGISSGTSASALSVAAPFSNTIANGLKEDISAS